MADPTQDLPPAPAHTLNPMQLADGTVIGTPLPCPFLRSKAAVHKKAKHCLGLCSALTVNSNLVLGRFEDKSVRFFNTDTTEEISICKEHKRSITCCTTSPMGLDGEEPVIATGSKDGTVILWDPVDQVLLNQFKMPVEEIRCISILNGKNETLMIVGCKDSQVLLWDLRNNQQLLSFKGHKGPVHCVFIASYCQEPETQNEMDFICTASGGADRCVRLWDYKTGKRKKKLRHDRSILTIALASKGIQPLLVSGGVDKVIRLWDLASGIELITLSGHIGIVNQIVIWEGYEILVLTASDDRCVRIFDALSGECVAILQGHNDDVKGVAISLMEDLPVIVSAGLDNVLMYWDLDQILCRFFVDDSGNPGARNKEPPWLPPLVYFPPEDLTQTEEVLAAKAKRREEREEKRRLRRIQKGQQKFDELKRQKMLEGGDENANFDFSAIDSNFVDDDDARDDDDDDDGDDGVTRAGGATKPIKIERKPGATGGIESSAARKKRETTVNEHDKKGSSTQGAEPTTTAAMGEKKSSFSLLRTLSSGKIQPEGILVGKEDGIMSTIVNGVASLTRKLSLKNIVGVEGSNSNGNNEASDNNIGGSKNSNASGRHTIREEDDKTKARKVQEAFDLANIEKQMELDRAKDKAKARLMRRNKNENNIDEGANANAGGGGGLSTGTGASEDKEDIEAIKADKLKQQKLQENRLKEAQKNAKSSASSALQKRLEEAKRLRELNPPPPDSDDSGEENNAPDVSSNSNKESIAVAVRKEKSPTKDPETDIYATSD